MRWQEEEPRWGDELLSLLSLLFQLTPEDLPEAPWVLKRTRAQQIGKSWVPSTPYFTVTNNERFLESLKKEARRGPGSARVRYGGLPDDLRHLARVIGEKRERERDHDGSAVA